MKSIGGMRVLELIQAQEGLMAEINDSFQAGVYDDFGDEIDLMYHKLERNKTVETRILILALEDELHEVLRELNWKPWKKTQKEVDLIKVREEIADCWHFLLELTILWGWQEVLKSLSGTFRKNHARAKGGY